MQSALPLEIEAPVLAAAHMETYRQSCLKGLRGPDGDPSLCAARLVSFRLHCNLPRRINGLLVYFTSPSCPSLYAR